MSTMTKTSMGVAMAALLLLGCKSDDAPKASMEDESYRNADKMSDHAPAMAPEAVMAEMEEESMDDGMRRDSEDVPMDRKRVAGKIGSRRAKKDSNVGAKEAKAKPGKGGFGGEQGPAPRAWFPETFLFNPLVVTDMQGDAKVDVRVPDRLTSWRVLALAHSRKGAQAGGTAQFLGTMEAYVDPVVPAFLRVGDKVRIPIQVVNNSDEPLKTTLKVDGLSLGKISGSPQSISMEGRSSSVRYITLDAQEPGEIRLLARMGDTDMVVRTITVLPTGKPVHQVQRGTLAAPRNFSLTGAGNSGLSKGRAQLAVFPGALALLRSELGASMHRGGMASAAFALLLAGRAPALLKSLGDEADPEALRKMTILSSQKVMRHARVLDVVSATLIAQAARSHAENPVLQRLAMRAMQSIEAGQAPDGTCGGQDGWTLQRLLVSTADCARAAHDSPNVTIRAQGAFERHAKAISDPYTAAAILAAGGVEGELRASLLKQVLEAIEATDNGAKILRVPANVVRADGIRPSVAHATALAVLALADEAGAPLADLGATILANYSPSRGWGDGRTNLVCMKAALVLFKDPIPDQVKIVLSKDGESVAEGMLMRSNLRDVLNLGATGIDISGEHQWSVSAEPAIPGLGFALKLTSWVPWSSADSAKGAELLLQLPEEKSVGKALLVSLVAAVPSDRDFEIELGLPAGVQVDETSLAALVSESLIYRFEKSEGKVKIFAKRLSAGARFTAQLRVIPTIGGSLQSGPATISVGKSVSHLAPVRWEVR